MEMAIETLGRSRGLAGLGSLPAFELPTVDGGIVQSWSYRSREHLVLVTAGSDPDVAVIQEMARREREVRAEDAAVLAVLQTEARDAAKLWEDGGRPGCAAVDPDGRVHAKLGVTNVAGLDGAPQPEILVVDRDGTIYWRAALSEAAPEKLVEEALGWLRYMNILEHECGTCVPAWPDEDLL